MTPMMPVIPITPMILGTPATMMGPVLVVPVLVPARAPAGVPAAPARVPAVQAPVAPAARVPVLEADCVIPSTVIQAGPVPAFLRLLSNFRAQPCVCKKRDKGGCALTQC